MHKDQQNKAINSENAPSSPFQIQQGKSQQLQSPCEGKKETEWKKYTV